MSKQNDKRDPYDQLRAAIQDLDSKGLLPYYRAFVVVDEIRLGSIEYPKGTMFLIPEMIKVTDNVQQS